MIGQVIRPAYQGTDMLNFPNSVNPKSFRYGNTEPSMNLRFKACVENVQEASIKDEDSFRTLWKHNELTGNKLVAYQKGYVVTIVCVMLMMVKRLPPYWVTNKVQTANSVKAKALSHANTELNSEKSDKCVETNRRSTLFNEGKDIVRAYRKLYDSVRNVLNTYIVGNNKIQGRNRYDLLPSCSWHRHFSVSEYNWMVEY